MSATIIQGRYEAAPSTVSSGNHRDIQVSATGVVAVSSIPSSTGTGLTFGSTANVVRIAPTASNGATPVQLVAASGTTTISPTTWLVSNPNTTGYWVYLVRGAATNILAVFLPPLGSYSFDGRGDVRTNAGERLAFVTEAGATNTIIASGAALQE